MFTGIIVEMGTVAALRRKQAGASLSVSSLLLPEESEIGDSIAVSGACLTVVGKDRNMLSFDLSDETLISTTLGGFRPGDKANLEPSLRADGKLGGHFVTGHVDAVGRIRSKSLVGDACRIVIDSPVKVAGLLVEKGSVAVDGISLTVVDVSEDSFSVVIIPHTAAVTTLGLKNPGDAVNLEADIIGKYVARFIGRGVEKKEGDESLLESLKNAGFIS